MIYDLKGINYQEAKQAVSASTVSIQKGETRGVPEFYKDGDILVMGTIPPFSLVTEAFIRMAERFPAGTTIDFGVPIWENDRIAGIQVLDTVPADSLGVLYKVELDAPIVDSASVPVGTYLLATTGPQSILIRLNLPSEEAIGKVDVIVPFTSYGIRSGAYTS